MLKVCSIHFLLNQNCFSAREFKDFILKMVKMK